MNGRSIALAWCSLLLALPAHGQAVRIFDRLDRMADVTITTPSNGQVLSYNGTKWVNSAASAGSGTVTSFAFTNSTGITGTVGTATTVPTLSLALTSAAVGLGNVDNTSDANKPISTATSTALSGKANGFALTAHTGSTSNPHSVTKTQVGLSNVDNTADTAKPVSTAQQTALDLKQGADADLTTWAGITPGTGVGTALAVNVGSAGALVANGGALGTPSSGTGTNLTGIPESGVTNLTADLALKANLTSATGWAFSTGTITTSQPFSIAQTWNANTAFVALVVDATSTLSDNNGKLFQLKRSGASKFYVDEFSNVYVGGATTGGILLTAPNMKFASNSLVSWSATSTMNSTQDIGFSRNAAGVLEINNGTAAGTFRDVKARNVISDNTVRLKGFTVATLPASPVVGDMAYVTDATAPTYNAALTGGGAVVVPVFYNGSAWTSH